MSQTQLKDKALEYIEKLCFVYENSDKTDLKNVDKIIEQIYSFAHCVQEKCKCYDAHDDWREELEKQDWEI